MNIKKILFALFSGIYIGNVAAINSPILTTPLNLSTNQGVSLVLDWSPVSGNTGYNWEVDTSIYFNSPLHLSGTTAINTSQVTVVNLRFGTVYYWRVATRENLNASVWTSIWSFTTVDNVTLVSPTNGALNQHALVVLDWSPVEGNTGYICEIDTCPAFNSPLNLMGNSPVNTSQYNASDLLFGTKYYWRAAVKDNADTSQWSATRSFTTLDNVTLVSPTNGALNQHALVVLDWSLVDGNTGYICEIDTCPAFNSPLNLIGNSPVNTSQYNASDLLFGTKYYWRAAVKDNTDTSQWSVTRSFTTLDNVTLVSPSNGATNLSVSPTIDWSLVDGNKGYLFQVDITPLFNSPQLIIGNSSINTSQATLSGLLYGNTYYWRAAVVDNSDTSQWSATWSFTTVYQLASPPILNLPINGSMNILLDGQNFSWTGVSGATSYEIQYCNNPLFTSGVVSMTIISTNHTINNLPALSTNYWRVRGKNVAGNSPWSQSWSFSTVNCSSNYSLSITSCDDYLFNGNILTSSGNFIDTLTASAGCDSIVHLDLTLNHSTSSIQSITACSSYFWNGKNYTSSGIFKDTIHNSASCDSVMTLILTIINIDTNVITSGNTLSAQQQGASYKWLNCFNNLGEIYGATNQSYSPPGDGSFAVEISLDGCIDTSFCHDFVISGFSENDATEYFDIYPNPSDGIFLINNLTGKGFECMITNSLGQLVHFEIFNSQKNKIDISGYPAGIYFIELKTDSNCIFRRKVIINKYR